MQWSLQHKKLQQSRISRFLTFPGLMCTEMMHKGERKSSAVYLAAAVILTCYLVQTIDCYRLRKTERREGQREADAVQTAVVQEGEILFGSGLGSHADRNKKSSSNTSVDDEAAYQADSAGWSKGQVYDPSPKEASFKRMAPSLQCGADQMKFRAVGPGATQFAVEQVNAAPMPLSQVPSTCGYNMQRNPLGLVLLVPYDGCNMVQEGGNYMLPMRWQGTPVSLMCPKPAAPAATTAAPHHPAPHHPAPQVPQNPHPYYFPPYMYPKYPVVPKPTTATTTTAKKPQVPQYPQYPFYPPFYPYPQPVPVTTAAPTTTAKPAAVTFPPPMYPFPFYPLPWPFPGPLPATPKPTTTTTTTKAPTKPQIPPFPPYLPFYPPFNPFYPPFVPPYPNFPTPKPTTTTPTTTTTATTTKKDPTPHPHIHPHVHYPYPIPPFPPVPFPISG